MNLPTVKETLEDLEYFKTHDVHLRSKYIEATKRHKKYYTDAEWLEIEAAL